MRKEGAKNNAKNKARNRGQRRAGQDRGRRLSVLAKDQVSAGYLELAVVKGFLVSGSSFLWSDGVKSHI